MTKKEKEILKKLVNHPLGLLSPVEFINGVAEHNKKAVENLVSMGFVDEVPKDISDNIHGTTKTLNFYRASEKGINQFAVWYKRLWFNFKNNITLYLAIASIIFGIISSVTSWYTVQNSIETNIISEQPFLSFVDINNKPYQFINIGKGVALNINLMLWDKPAGQLYTTPEGAVIEAIAPGTTPLGCIDSHDLIKTDFAEVKNKLPSMSKLFQATEKEDTSWFSLNYEDIYGRKYSTLIRGPGTKEYTKAVEFIDFDR
jgi:hypothetical protein